MSDEGRTNRVAGSDIIGRNVRADKDYRVVLYDFKRPDKFSKEQIRTIALIHETFARMVTASLTAMLVSGVKAHVALVDQCTYEEYLREVPNPAVISIVHLDPLKGAGLMSFPNQLVFGMIERLFGATSVRRYVPEREIGEIECAAVEQIMIRLLAGFRESWMPILDMRPRLGAIETNPQFVQMVPPTEMIVYVEIECKIDNVESAFTVAYPFITIEPIVSRLSALRMYNTVSRFARGKQKQAVLLGDLESVLSVAVDGPALSLVELARLKPGDLIPLRGVEEGDGYLLLNGTPIARMSWKTPEAMLEGEFTVTAETPEAGIDDETPEEEPPRNDLAAFAEAGAVRLHRSRRCGSLPRALRFGAPADPCAFSLLPRTSRRRGDHERAAAGAQDRCHRTDRRIGTSSS